MCAATTLAFSAAVVPVDAADEAVMNVAVVTDKSTVEANDEITVSVEVENNTGFNAWEFFLTYDDEAFTPVIVEDETFFDDDGDVVGPPEGSTESPLGKFSWAKNAKANKDDGVIMYITFKVNESAKPGNYTIAISDAQFLLSKKKSEGGGSTPVEFTTSSTEVTVEGATVEVTELTVTPESIDFAAVGLTQSIKAVVNPDATDPTVTYKSGNTAIATVDSTGLVTAVGEGAATITVTAGKLSKTVKVNVAHTHELELVEAVDPTCDKDGNIKYYKCTKCGKLFSDAEGENEITEADTVVKKTGHNYGEPTYTWVNDTEKCTAEKVCKNDKSHVISETVLAVKKVTKEPTYDEKGEATWTATFTKDADFETQVKTTDIPVKKATYEKVEAKDATCEEAGNIEYFVRDDGAFFVEKDGAKAPVNKEDVVIPATGHDYGEPTYTWASDYSKCTAKKVCKNDKTHVVSETVKSTKKVIKEPTYEEKGSVRYSVVFTTDDAFVSQSKTVDVPAKEPNFEFVEAKAATCEEPGNIEYFVRDDGTYFVEKDGVKVPVDAEDVVVPATGHDYAAPTYTWNTDYSKCTAKMVCNNDATHVVEETVDTEKTVITEPTYEEKGLAKFTATFTNKNFETQTKDDVVLPAKVHEYTAVEGKAATCEEDGNKPYFRRDDGKLFEDMAGTVELTEEDVVIPAFGHEWEVEVDSIVFNEDHTSCTARAVCKNDPTHKMPLETDRIEVVGSVAASCTAEGSVTYLAKFYEGFEAEVTETTEVLGHDWGEWEVTTEATEDEDGEETRVCSVCGETETRAIPATGSDDSEDEDGDDSEDEDGDDSDTDSDTDSGDDSEDDGDTDGGDDSEGDNSSNGGTSNAGTSTNNPVTGAAAALSAIAAAFGALAIFKKKK